MLLSIVVETAVMSITDYPTVLQYCEQALSLSSLKAPFKKRRINLKYNGIILISEEL